MRRTRPEQLTEWYIVLAAYNKTMLIIKTVIAVRLFTPEWTAARTNSGTAAQRASSMAIKWVSALPGSRIVMFIVVPPPYIWIQWNAYFAGILCQV